VKRIKKQRRKLRETGMRERERVRLREKCHKRRQM
jgi:hypothetical protein